jgi:hypothetical protein
LNIAIAIEVKSIENQTYQAFIPDACLDKYGDRYSKALIWPNPLLTGNTVVLKDVLKSNSGINK